MSAGMALSAKVVGLDGLQAGLARMAALGAAPRPIWEALGQYGESSTRLRFKNQTDPDGARWKPSIRARLAGGQTLVQTARLLRSITHRTSNAGTAWGTHVKYAAVHNYGAVIKPKAAGALRFQMPGAGFVTVKRVTIPKRTFIGVNADDATEMLALAAGVVDAAAQPRGAA